MAGERQELWADGPGVRQRRRPTKASNTGSQFSTDKQQQRCLELAADGQYAKAVKALVSSGPLGRNEETMKALQDKHPLAQANPDLSDLVTPGKAQVPEFDCALVNKMVKSFTRGTAPGPSGLRAQHLRDAIRSTHGDEALVQLTPLCNLLARGDAP